MNNTYKMFKGVNIYDTHDMIPKAPLCILTILLHCYC